MMNEERIKERNEKMHLIEKLIGNEMWDYEIYPYEDLPVIGVQVNVGDWKHEHLWLDNMLGSNGFIKMNEKQIITGDPIIDEGDTYSSVHYFGY